MPRMLVSVSIPQDQIWMISKLEKYAKTERTTVSELIRRAIKEYVARHGEGNPQTVLLPTTEVEVFPLEQRKRNVDWLVDLVRANPGRDLVFWCHFFSQKAGLTPDTVQGYIKSLRITGVLVKRGGKLYHRDEVPA